MKLKGFVKVCFPSAAVSNAFLRGKVAEGTDVVLLVKPGLRDEEVLKCLLKLVHSVTEGHEPTKLDWGLT